MATKVYSCPESVQFSGHSYQNFDLKAEEAKITAHKEQLKKWLLDQGYNGEYTGEVIKFNVADGYAQYMVGDKGTNGRGFILIHLPYWDAYQFNYVGKLSKADIVYNIKTQRKMDEFFKR